MFDKWAAALSAALVSSCVAPQGDVPAPSAAGMAAARTLAPAPTEWVAACADWDEWDKPAPAFRIHGDTYHVGTCGISAILVAGPQGDVLLDTGTRDGSSEIMSNIRNLGLYQENLRAILTSHEHYDHVGGASSAQKAAIPAISSGVATRPRGMSASSAPGPLAPPRVAR